MSWFAARGLLANSVTRHLGEDLLIAQPGEDGATANARGVLTRPEQLVRLGLSQTVADEARLTLKVADAPAWFARGVVVTTAAGEEFDVSAVTDNGEGLLEVVLCRSL